MTKFSFDPLDCLWHQVELERVMTASRLRYSLRSTLEGVALDLYRLNPRKLSQPKKMAMIMVKTAIS